MGNSSSEYDKEYERKYKEYEAQLEQYNKQRRERKEQKDAAKHKKSQQIYDDEYDDIDGNMGIKETAEEYVDNRFNNRFDNKFIDRYDNRYNDRQLMLVPQYKNRHDNVTIYNVNDRVKKYHEEEEEMDRKFRFEQDELKRKYEREKLRRREIYDREINKFENSEYDPYKVLGLNKDTDITLNEIRTAYKKMAIKNHPDKGGDVKKFKLITQSYCYLVDKHKEVDKALYKMKEEVKPRKYLNDTDGNRDNMYMSKDNFNINKFNEIFEKHFVDDEDDDRRGYGDYMDKTKRQLDDDNDIFTNKFNREIFSKTFEDEVEQPSEVVKYKEPDALDSNKSLTFKELGSKVNDFSIKEGKTTVTDYKKAYTKNNFDATKVKYKEYKNVQELKNARESASMELTQDEKIYYKKKNAEQNKKEHDRLERLKKQDEKKAAKHNDINHIYIKT